MKLILQLLLKVGLMKRPPKAIPVKPKTRRVPTYRRVDGTDELWRVH